MLRNSKNELRSRPTNETNDEQDDLYDDDEDIPQEVLDESLAISVKKTREGKMANQPCRCGSGKKYKKCCSTLRISEAQKRTEQNMKMLQDKQQEQEYNKWKSEWG